MPENKAVGIDLGTTRTAVAQILAEEAEIVENADGSPVTPSVVRIEEDGEVVVGEQADKDSAIHSDRTIRKIKRDMGTDASIVIDDVEYVPEQISAMILEKVVSDAEDRVGMDISEAVITVPAYFGESERSATKAAGEVAGLDVQRLLPEPSAACLTYAQKKEKLEADGEELIFVYDLGGGTFDASLVEADYDVNYYETQNTDGLNELGGEDWTDAIVDWMLEISKEESGEDFSGNEEIVERFRNEAEEAKHSLSSRESTTVKVPFVTNDYNFEADLTREKFDSLTEDLIQQTREPIEDLFDRSEHSIDDVDTVLLIGGSSRMQQVDSVVEDIFGMEPSKEVSPDKAVAHGAAIQAGILDRAAKPQTDQEDAEYGVSTASVNHAVSQSLGVELNDGTTAHIIESDETMPVENRDETFQTIRDDQTIVEFPILEGESEQASENDTIGKVILGEEDGIPPRSPNEDSLAIEFLYDEDGTLQVEAEDLLSGKQVDAKFEGVGKHTEEEIEAMKADTPSVGVKN